MSIIGNNLLTKIIIDNHFENPSEILELLDNYLRETITTGPITVNDGMDLGLCVIDTYFNEVNYAGAYRPIFFINKDEEVEEIIGNPFPIGGSHHLGPKKFDTKRFPVSKGQRIYLSSDGFYSQFGGGKGKKLMKSHFKDILKEIQPFNMENQKSILKNKFSEWSGDNEQVDDIMVLGFEI
jgi:serine phosphatase RsbU (regulator of sigma subunit)